MVLSFACSLELLSKQRLIKLRFGYANHRKLGNCRRDLLPVSPNQASSCIAHSRAIELPARGLSISHMLASYPRLGELVDIKMKSAVAVDNAGSFLHCGLAGISNR